MKTKTEPDLAYRWLSHQADRLSEVADLLGGMSVNEVLLSELVILDSSGSFEKTFRVRFGAFAALNLSGAMVTLHTQPRQATPPLQGRGVHALAAGGFGVFNSLGTVLSVYGTAGQSVDLQVFSNSQPPNFG